MRTKQEACFGGLLKLLDEGGEPYWILATWMRTCNNLSSLAAGLKAIGICLGVISRITFTYFSKKIIHFQYFHPFLILSGFLCNLDYPDLKPFSPQSGLLKSFCVQMIDHLETSYTL